MLEIKKSGNQVKKMGKIKFETKKEHSRQNKHEIRKQKIKEYVNKEENTESEHKNITDKIRKQKLKGYVNKEEEKTNENKTYGTRKIVK